MQEEIFTTVKLPVSGEATIYEGKGRHYFAAMLKSNGNSGLIIKYLILEIVRVNDKKLSEQQLDDMHLRDITYLATVIGTMMSDDFMGKF